MPIPTEHNPISQRRKFLKSSATKDALSDPFLTERIISAWTEYYDALRIQQEMNDVPENDAFNIRYILTFIATAESKYDQVVASFSESPQIMVNIAQTMEYGFSKYQVTREDLLSLNPTLFDFVMQIAEEASGRILDEKAKIQTFAQAATTIKLIIHTLGVAEYLEQMILSDDEDTLELLQDFITIPLPHRLLEWAGLDFQTWHDQYPANKHLKTVRASLGNKNSDSNVSG